MKYMNTEEFKLTDRYRKIVENNYLKDNLLFLIVGGSYSYGLDTETSDVDLRGVFKSTLKDIVVGKEKKTIPVDKETSLFNLTTAIKHFTKQDPCFLQHLFVPDELVLYRSQEGELLFKNRELFLSKSVSKTFLGFSSSVIYKLEENELGKNYLKGSVDYYQSKLDDLKKAIPSSYKETNGMQLDFYIGESNDTKTGMDVFMDVNFKHLSVQDYYRTIFDAHQVATLLRVWDMQKDASIVRKRMSKQLCYSVLALVWLMDIMQYGTYCTRPERYHDELMDIKLGKYTTEDFNISREFYQLYEQIYSEATDSIEHGIVPDKIDEERINQLKYDIIVSNV